MSGNDPTDNAWDALNQALDRETDRWYPEEEGDIISGKVIALAERDGQYGTSPVVTILTRDNREVEVIGSRSVLRSQIMEAGFRVGDLGGFKYEGKRVSASGSEYHAYRVVRLDDRGNPPDRTGEPTTPRPNGSSAAAGTYDLLEPRDDDLSPF